MATLTVRLGLRLRSLWRDELELSAGGPRVTCRNEYSTRRNIAVEVWLVWFILKMRPGEVDHLELHMSVVDTREYGDEVLTVIPGIQ